jgi:hypothetical protein
MRNCNCKIFLLTLVAALCVFTVTARAADDKDILGVWKLKYDPGDGQTHEPVVKITKDRAGLKAEFIDGENKVKVKEISYKDGELRLKIEGEYMGDKAIATYKGKTRGDSIKGVAEWEYQGMTGTYEFEGKREAAKEKK